MLIALQIAAGLIGTICWFAVVYVVMQWLFSMDERRKLRDLKASQRKDWSTVSDGKTERTFRGDGKLMHTRELPPVKWPERN